MILKINKKTDNDRLTITYHLSRTKDWKECKKHSLVEFFKVIIHDSCRSGYVELNKSAFLPDRKFLFECSNGDHTCSEHPSVMKAYIKNHENNIVESIENLSEEAGYPITVLKRLGVERHQGMFAS